MFVSCLMSSSVYDKMTFIIPMGRLAMLGPRDRIHVPIYWREMGKAENGPRLFFWTQWNRLSGWVSVCSSLVLRPKFQHRSSSKLPGNQRAPRAILPTGHGQEKWNVLPWYFVLCPDQFHTWLLSTCLPWCPVWVSGLILLRPMATLCQSAYVEFLLSPFPPPIPILKSSKLHYLFFIL